MTAKHSNVKEVPHQTLVRTAYIVGKHSLKTIDGRLMPGEIVDVSAWSPAIIDTHLNLGWLEEVKLVSDADREAFDLQRVREAKARVEAAKNAPKEEPKPPPRQPSQPEPAVILACANCGQGRVAESGVGRPRS